MSDTVTVDSDRVVGGACSQQVVDAMQHLQLTTPGGGGGGELACRRTLYDSLTVEGLSPNPDTQATGNHYTHATHTCIFYLCMYMHVW